MFIGSNFILGLLGDKSKEGVVNELEAYCKEASSKPVKVNKKADVKFDFKIKGQKPVVTKDICFFNITGADFNGEKIGAIMDKNEIKLMD